MDAQVREHDAYYYQIKVAGQLDEEWLAWLKCTAITCETTDDDQVHVTVLTYLTIDQPALRGLLNKLFDLNLTLLSVDRRSPDADKNEFQTQKNKGEK